MTFLRIRSTPFYFLSRRKRLSFAVSLIILTGIAIIGYYVSMFIYVYIHFLMDPEYHLRRDRHILINLTNFYYQRNPMNICQERFKNQKSQNIIGIVHSARGNFLAREIIRRTHGSVTFYRGWNIQVVFALGIAPPLENITFENLIHEEGQKYGDLIIGNFEDTYKNMSYKHTMMYLWSTEFCPQANYYLKSDDDVLVNIFFIINFLMAEGVRKPEEYDKEKDFYCTVMPSTKPVRENDSRWYVSMKEYSKEFYPNYCGYGSYVVGVKSIRKIARVSSKIGYFWVDDVFVTGMLRERANDEENNPNNFIRMRSAESQYNGFDGLSLDAPARKDVLGVIVEERSPNMSCRVWDSILQQSNAGSDYVSKCNELFQANFSEPVLYNNG